MSGGMPMPGGWTMSMAWMRMPEQSRSGAAAAFLGMWTLMMLAIMLPSLVPMLSRYRRSLRGRAERRLGRLTAVAGTGYFLVWAAVGAAAYPLGVLLADACMRWPPLARSVPAATGAVLLLAGAYQLTTWKARQLERCCDGSPAGPPPSPTFRDAWRHGLGLGGGCARCCSGFVAVLLVTGVMELGAMALVAGAITAERLSPWPERAARVAGVAVLAGGVVAIVRAVAG
jgi:predicted metal-binding membrane protein